jgi:phosphohistidine phosphatase
MDLLLLRHADALESAASDLARPLSPKGHRQAAEVAQSLQTSTHQPSLILSSPAVRTMETAAVVASLLKLKVIACPWALPGMSPDAALEALSAYRVSERVLLVGHQPDISLLAAQLLGLPHPNRLHIGKASLMHLSLVSPGVAALESFVQCKLT